MLTSASRARSPGVMRPRVVVDVRGNDGGSSTWGWELANGLWGEAYVNAAHENSRAGRPPIVIEWRASAANQAAMEKNAIAIGATMGAEAREWAESAAQGIASRHSAARHPWPENRTRISLS